MGVLAGWIEGTIIVGVSAAIGGGLVALVGLGIPKDQALKYELDIKAGNYGDRPNVQSNVQPDGKIYIYQYSINGRF